MRHVAWVIVVVLALVGAGCGDDGDEADEASATTEEASEAGAETTSEADEGACDLVTVDAVAEAFGEPAELVDARPSACDILVGDVSLNVQRIDGGIDPEDTTLTACEEGTRVEVEAGDAAHVCITEAYPAPFGAVSRGDVAVWIGTPANTDEAVRDRIAALLPLVTVPG
ncbi:MAG TPA: hypothetical protein VF228_13625 [Iamia sp.]